MKTKYTSCSFNGLLLTVAALFLTHGEALAVSCPGNNPNDIMVKVGPLCVDKYEASVWSNSDGTGTQYPQANPRFPPTFPVNGNWTQPLYAVSKRGVNPTAFISWFQAQQACAASGKRLLTNAEWQMAAAGTPDPGALGDGLTTCNTNTTGPVPTGSSHCVSKWSVHDMVGNVQEWVGDWIQGPGINANGVTGTWDPLANEISTAAFGNDSIAGINEAFHLEAPQTGPGSVNAAIDALPTAIIRGGLWNNSDGAGVFRLFAEHTPSSLDNGTGFRCAR